jgi:hypothetical protein
MNRISLTLTALILGIQGVSADLLTQIDPFDSGVLNWESGANPVHISTGGPLGDGDGFLSLSRPESSPFHIAAFNKTQWTGDFLTPGITTIEMDLNALAGPSLLRVRIMLWGDGGVWASTGLTAVSAGWNHYTFGLSASDLIYVNDDMNNPAGSGGGTGVLADTLRNVTILQLRHDYETPTAPGNHPQHISATLGIDNVQAVPEPSTLAYLGISTVILLLRRTQQHRPIPVSDISPTPLFTDTF